MVKVAAYIIGYGILGRPQFGAPPGKYQSVYLADVDSDFCYRCSRVAASCRTYSEMY